MSRRSTFLLFLLLLLAAVLRFYRLDGQSLWSDEGSSVAQALRDIPTIAANAARDIHPPLYYIVLHFWVIPFGTSEVGVRSLSAALGVALVGLCYLLGTELWDERMGLIAAFLAAINPFQVYYAQEARMYMLMAVLGATCVYATLKSQAPISKSQRRWYVVYVLAATMGLYTHYFFPIVLVVCNLIYLVAAWRVRFTPQRHHATAVVSWLLLQAVALLAFLPWLPMAMHQISTWPSGAQTFTASDAPIVLLRTLSLGLSALSGDGGWLALFGVLLVLGAFTSRQVNSGATRLVYSSTRLLVYLLAPILVMFALALFKDAFLKFILVASPPFVLLVANGLWLIADGISRIAHHASRIAHHASRITHYALRIPVCPVSQGSALRRAEHATQDWRGANPVVSGTNGGTHHVSRLTPLVLALALTLPSIASLQNYYFDPRFARDDYRAIAHTIDALARSDDAIVLNAPGQQEIFGYYYHSVSAVYPLPRQRPLDVAATESELAGIAARHPRVFVVLWAADESDPTGAVEAWLDTHAFKASDDWYGNVRLVSYSSQRVGNQIQQSIIAHWGDAITLQGYTLGASAINAGEVLPLTLFWRAEQPITRRYKVFVHLLDPRGFVIAQRDAEPVGGSRPTMTWQRGETIADPYGLFIPFGTPPLTYSIEVGLYDPTTGARLKLSTGDDHLLLKPVSVMPTTAPRAIPGVMPLNVATANGLTLLGYRVDKVGAEGQRAVAFRAGDALHLTLFWRETEPTTSDGAYRLQLGMWTKQTTPTEGLYPVGQWNVGAVVRDDQIITLAGDWRAGRYALTVDDATITNVQISD